MELFSKCPNASRWQALSNELREIVRFAASCTINRVEDGNVIALMIGPGLGTRSERRWYWFCTSAQAALAFSSSVGMVLTPQALRKSAPAATQKREKYSRLRNGKSY